MQNSSAEELLHPAPPQSPVGGGGMSCAQEAPAEVSGRDAATTSVGLL